MNIIGINQVGYISSVALLKNGELIAAAAEERFTRKKLTRMFPHNALDFCLKKGGISIEDVECIALGWNPAINITKLQKAFSNVEKQRYMGEYFYSSPSHLLQHIKDRDFAYTEQHLHFKNKEYRIYHINHHDSHLASSYFASPFKESAILSADGFGEKETVVFAVGKKNKIERIQTMEFPQSLGMFYSSFTQFLGFEYDSDEWKVMAMASFKEPKNKYYPQVKKLVRLLPNGTFELDLNCFEFYNFETTPLYNQKFIDAFGQPRKPEDELEDRHFEIAAAMQKVAEETIFHCLNWLYEKTRMRNICVSGGFFMNSVINGKILGNTKFSDVYVSSAPDDSGNCFGAALYLYNHILSQEKRYVQKSNYLGPSFSDKEIKNELDKFKLKYKYIEDIESVAAKLLVENKIVAWFQGCMEFGQRALGNRSILADPRDPSMKDRINEAVKYRESFRPFAPSILKENVREYFDIEEGVEVPFMEKVYYIKKHKRSVIPAVCHVDGTGRLQTVSKETNPRYYTLIQEFEKLTGVPVILNTSFNLKGEPIVLSVKDAIRTFYTSGLDALAIGNYLIEKEIKNKN
ncbi:carbamoyltransferase [Candidatus Woesearchaeota archaeon]|nr:carbamoyltransferase [Candidatus Woesearchaeota archaeon]